MTKYQDYFENMLSRTWLGAHKLDKNVSLAKSHVQEIYFETGAKNKVIILGKTEKYFFVLEGFHNDDFYYSNGLFNDSMIELINSYKDKEIILQGVKTEKFVDSILLYKNLDQKLSVKTMETVRKLKI